MSLTLDDVPAIDRLTLELVERRELAARMDLDDQWTRYAHALTVLRELRVELTGEDDG